jgi:hypothetical protein
MTLPIDPQALDLEWPAYEELAQKRADLQNRLNETGARAWRLEREDLRAAREQDATLYAGAILGGSSKPKGPPAKHEAEVQAEIEEALRERGGLEVALREVDGQIEKLMTESAPAWAKEVAAATEEAGQSYRYAVEQMLSTRARYFALRRLRRHLETGEPVKRIPADFQPPVIKTTHHGMFHEQQDLREISRLLIAEAEKE